MIGSRVVSVYVNDECIYTHKFYDEKFVECLGIFEKNKKGKDQHVRIKYHIKDVKFYQQYFQLCRFVNHLKNKEFDEFSKILQFQITKKLERENARFVSHHPNKFFNLLVNNKNFKLVKTIKKLVLTKKFKRESHIGRLIFKEMDYLFCDDREVSILKINNYIRNFQNISIAHNHDKFVYNYEKVKKKIISASFTNELSKVTGYPNIELYKLNFCDYEDSYASYQNISKKNILYKIVLYLPVFHKGGELNFLQTNYKFQMHLPFNSSSITTSEINNYNTYNFIMFDPIFCYEIEPVLFGYHISLEFNVYSTIEKNLVTIADGEKQRFLILNKIKKTYKKLKRCHSQESDNEQISDDDFNIFNPNEEIAMNNNNCLNFSRFQRSQKIELEERIRLARNLNTNDIDKNLVDSVTSDEEFEDDDSDYESSQKYIKGPKINSDEDSENHSDDDFEFFEDNEYAYYDNVNFIKKPLNKINRYAEYPETTFLEPPKEELHLITEFQFLTEDIDLAFAKNFFQNKYNIVCGERSPYLEILKQIYMENFETLYSLKKRLRKTDILYREVSADIKKEESSFSKPACYPCYIMSRGYRKKEVHYFLCNGPYGDEIPMSFEYDYCVYYVFNFRKNIDEKMKIHEPEREKLTDVVNVNNESHSRPHQNIRTESDTSEDSESDITDSD